jgi:hypothetical protein
MAIMISIPAGITSNQASTETLTEDLSNTITRTEETINQTQTQIDCTLASSFEGFGFNPSEMPDRGDSGFTPPTGDDSSTPGQFGGGFRPGRFGGGTFGRGGTTAMNATLYDDISSVDAVAAVVPSLEASEGTEQTIERFGQSFTTLVPRLHNQRSSVDL